MKIALIIFSIIVNLVLYSMIVVLSALVLYKIKLKLNLKTKIGFYLNVIALGLRILFTVW